MQATAPATPKISAAESGPTRAGIGWLWTYVLKHRKAAALAILTGIIGGAATAFQPVMVGKIIDDVRQGLSLATLAGDVLLLLILAGVITAAFWGQRFYSGAVAYNINFDIRRALFVNLLTLDQGFYQRYPAGDLISRVHSDMEMVWRLLALGFNRFGSATFTLIIAIILLGSVNLPLTLVTFVVLGISTYFQLGAGAKLASMFEDVQTQAGNLSALVQDTISGIQTIKTFGREAGVAQAYYRENREFRRRWLFFKRRYEPVGMLPNMIAESTAGIVVLLGGWLTVTGAMTLGNFVQFLLYLGFIAQVLLQLGTIYQRYQQAKGAMARITPLLQAPAIADSPEAKPLTAPRGEITFEHVDLELDGTRLLTDINLHIPAGQVVAFVGPTGCGKTLMVNLLARVFDVTKGRVLVDGVDVRDLKLEDLRAAIAYVPQSTFLFSQPLHRNVRMAHLELDDEALFRALSISRLSNDLPQLPHGLETLVGEKGVMLSGGQRQRVAIARALVHDPAILVLDDALSSVDTRTAADILSNLREVLRSRTSLIIAHRIATVKDADWIVVMDGGRVVEQGTHKELIERGGLYASMAKREGIMV